MSIALKLSVAGRLQAASPLIIWFIGTAFWYFSFNNIFYIDETQNFISPVGQPGVRYTRG